MQGQSRRAERSEASAGLSLGGCRAREARAERIWALAVSRTSGVENFIPQYKANSRRRKDGGPFGLLPMRPRWRFCTTQHNGSNHAWKPPICSKGDSRTASWTNPKRNIQRPRMLANVRRLVERREAMPLIVVPSRSETAVKGDCKEPRSGRD